MAKKKMGEDVVVWKFALDERPNQKVAVQMPRIGTKLLSVAVQDETVVVYAEVMPSQAKADREFWLTETGKSVPPTGGAFVGTVMLLGGAYVLHVYDLGWA